MTDSSNSRQQFFSAFDAAPHTAPAATQFISALPDCGLITASGIDAAAFLHKQLTNDVEHLTPHEARLAGYCSPKGRLLATLLIWRRDDQLFLQLPHEIQAGMQKRLQMFVMRAQVKLVDETDTHIALGIVGSEPAQALHPWFDTLPATPYSKLDTPAGTLLRLADSNGMPRYQWWAQNEIALAAWPQLQQLPLATASRWRHSEIRAGIPQVTALTQEQFVPQMINFELIGGVNFKKGCYPGQEIVARSQYLGKLKRRMLGATIQTGEAWPGMEVFSSSDPLQPCGMLVNAEKNDAGGFDCLVEIKTAMVEQGSIHLGKVDGAPLHFFELPYGWSDPAQV